VAGGGKDPASILGVLGARRPDEAGDEFLVDWRLGVAAIVDFDVDGDVARADVVFGVRGVAFSLFLFELLVLFVDVGSATSTVAIISFVFFLLDPDD
jgi:hypothetical protein